MNTHYMNLVENQMDLIRIGSKVIEIRLNDDKRKLIKTGDIICFSQVENNEVLLSVKVKSIKKFPTFHSLYSSYKPVEVGSPKNDSIQQMVDDTYEIYSPELEKEFGVLAIEIGIK